MDNPNTWTADDWLHHLNERDQKQRRVNVLMGTVLAVMACALVGVGVGTLWSVKAERYRSAGFISQPLASQPIANVLLPPTLRALSAPILGGGYTSGGSQNITGYAGSIDQDGDGTDELSCDGSTCNMDSNDDGTASIVFQGEGGEGGAIQFKEGASNRFVVGAGAGNQGLLDATVSLQITAASGVQFDLADDGTDDLTLTESGTDGVDIESTAVIFDVPDFAVEDAADPYIALAQGATRTGRFRYDNVADTIDLDRLDTTYKDAITIHRLTGVVTIGDGAEGSVTLTVPLINDAQLSATPTEPATCDASAEGMEQYVDDTDDTAWGQKCICANLDGTGYDWRASSDVSGTACPFF